MDQAAAAHPQSSASPSASPSAAASPAAAGRGVRVADAAPDSPERDAWRVRRVPEPRPLGGGVWSIPVPIPRSPLRYTLVYLLESDAGPVLVDSGWDDPAGRQALTDGLAAAGFTPAEVHGVLITHHHPDHHGLSGWLREQSGAWIAMHPAEAEAARALGATRTREGQLFWAQTLTEQGAPLDHLLALAEATAPRPRTPAADGAAGAVATADPLVGVAPDRTLTDGESAGVPGRNVRVVWTPGHTPGHVCLYLDEEVDGERRPRLLSGDHLLPSISPVISLVPTPDGPLGDPLGDFLDSLARVAALHPAEVLPAHQYRFTDAAGRVRELLDHHRDRLAELHDRLRDHPLTLWEAAAAMPWNLPWPQLDPVARTLALSEAAAHLQRLLTSHQATPHPTPTPARYGAL